MKTTLNKFKTYLLFFLIINTFILNSEEMIFGEEIIDPGIKIIFEAAPKDQIFPNEFYLSESQTDVHIEMLINWSKDSPNGSPVGGFIPYLDVTVIISNKDGQSLKTKLTPHINIVDNFHYAQNISLPGKIDDIYEVTVIIEPPLNDALGIHFDWKEKYGSVLTKKIFNYKNLSFKEIALKKRR
tara:strand:+ start:6234 stop:6785 length:552 start_codon:yes stop_codon:yes gene_type:complete